MIYCFVIILVMNSSQEREKIVIDNGSGMIRAGFAGDDAPRCQLKSLISSTFVCFLSSFFSPNFFLFFDFFVFFFSFFLFPFSFFLFLFLFRPGKIPTIGYFENEATANHLFPLQNGEVIDWDGLEKIWGK